MAVRVDALCDGKSIGIESIYTVVDGKQINKPDKLKELRMKSQQNQLFCPCGCGANLVLVAGDRNLHEQHFRIKDGSYEKYCHIKYEDPRSIYSKINLKCWLEDNLHEAEIESRVPISSISDSNRKYELSFITRKYGIVLNYCYDRANLSDEKMQILKENADKIRIIHIVDAFNETTSGQYPEGLMKIQETQGYCLLLDSESKDYNTSRMSVVYYYQNSLGIWDEKQVVSGLLKDFRIMPYGQISINGQLISEYIASVQKEFLEQKEVKKITEKEYVLSDEERNEIRYRLENEQEMVFDSADKRWLKCYDCEMIARESGFKVKGINNNVNLGVCRNCAKSNQKEEPLNNSQDVCPKCGSKLIEKDGRNGKFIGCTNFPNCRYSHSISK